MLNQNSENQTTARPQTAALRLVDNPPPPEERDIPFDVHAEKALLGSCIIGTTEDILADVRELVPTAESFYCEAHATIYSTILDLSESGLPFCDGVILASELQKRDQLKNIGGVKYLEEIIGYVPSAANAAHYAGIVSDLHKKRKLISAYTAGLKRAYDNSTKSGDLIEEAEGWILAMNQGQSKSTGGTLGEALSEAMEKMDRQSGESIYGMSTGLIELDRVTSGLQDGELIILAARPSVGKTALAMNIAEHVGIELKKPIAIFSMEMNKLQIATRVLTARAKIGIQELRRGMMPEDKRKLLAYTVGEISSSPIYIDDTRGMTLATLRSKCRQYRMKQGIELVVIDYLQLMEGAGENRQSQISAISRGIKCIAGELNIPVLCLSQLNRSSETQERRPRTSDLRESGAIEQDADVVMLLHREAMLHKGDEEWASANLDKLYVADLIVAKNRNGPCDSIKLTFLETYTRFVNFSPGV